MRAVRAHFLPISVALVCTALAGCQTQFFGSPMFEGGPSRCHTHCEQQGMQMDSFIYAGAFSTACVCGLKPAPGQPATGEHSTRSDATAAAAGVVIQTRAAQQQQANTSK